jgi:hypothetical protein
MKLGLFKVDDGLKCNCIKIFATGEGFTVSDYPISAFLIKVGLWCLTPLSTIFQLYHGSLFDKKKPHSIERIRLQDI